MQKTLFLALLLLVLCSCGHRPMRVTGCATQALAVDASSDPIQDEAYLAKLAPVKNDLEREMNVQIGYAPADMCIESSDDASEHHQEQ